MIIFGYYNSIEHEPVGPRACRRCLRDTPFVALRRFRRSHLYFVPLPFMKTELPAEWIECRDCGTQYPITVLADGAARVISPQEAALATCESTLDQFGRIVEITPTAGKEIHRRLAAGRYGDDVAIRIRPDPQEPHEFQVQFDYAEADGRDWIDEAHGLTIVVERREAAELHGRTIDFRAGRFCDR